MRCMSHCRRLTFISLSAGPYLQEAPVIIDKPDVVYMVEKQPVSITVTLNHVNASVTWKRYLHLDCILVRIVVSLLIKTGIHFMISAQISPPILSLCASLQILASLSWQISQKLVRNVAYNEHRPHFFVSDYNSIQSRDTKTCLIFSIIYVCFICHVSFNTARVSVWVCVWCERLVVHVVLFTMCSVTLEPIVTSASVLWQLFMTNVFGS